MHFNLQNTVALAGFATPALDVEGKTAGVKATHLTVGQRGKNLTDIGKQSRIGGRIGAGRAADGRLVNHNHLVQIFYALNGRMLAGAHLGSAVEGNRERFGKNLIDLDLRNKYSVNVVAIKSEEKTDVTPDPKVPMEKNQTILISGRNEDIRKLSVIK